MVLYLRVMRPSVGHALAGEISVLAREEGLVTLKVKLFGRLSHFVCHDAFGEKKITEVLKTG
jgi:hypothetical protein